MSEFMNWWGNFLTVASLVQSCLHSFEHVLRGWTYSRYWSLIFLSCTRSGFRLFIFLSTSMWVSAFLLSSSSNFFLLLWISSTLDCSSSELVWILWGREGTTSVNCLLVCCVSMLNEHGQQILNHTCLTLCCCLMWGTCRCILCCSALEFHTPPQRSEWFHWKPLWLSACSAAPEGERKQLFTFSFKADSLD